MENRIFKLDDNLVDDIHHLYNEQRNRIIGIVAEYIWDKYTSIHRSSDEVSQNTIDIIEPYCTKISSEDSEFDMLLFPDELVDKMNLIDDLREYYDEFKQLSTDEQENAEGDNYDLMCIARDCDNIFYDYLNQTHITNDFMNEGFVIISKR